MYTKRVMQVYLSGPINGLSKEEARDWREKVVPKFEEGIITLSPMRGEDGSLPSGKKLTAFYDGILTNPDAIFARDKFDVINSDALLVNLLQCEDRVSIGTMFEMAWANIWSGKKILIVTVMDEKNVHRHPFVEKASDWIVPDLDTAVDVLNTVLLP